MKLKVYPKENTHFNSFLYFIKYPETNFNIKIIYFYFKMTLILKDLNKI